MAIFVPTGELYWQAHDVLLEMGRRTDALKIIRTDDALQEARRAIDAGAEVIVARGLQASIISRYTDVPVVYVTLTKQSIIDQIEKAKRILSGKASPTIALVLFRNMSCDLHGVAEQCGVRLQEYYVQNIELLRSCVDQAIRNGADIILGGETANEIAEASGFPSLFLTNSGDSFQIAIREAQALLRSLQKPPVKKSATKTGAGQFVNFPYQSPRMKRCVALAEQFARTPAPKLIIEPAGELAGELALAIHNHSGNAGERVFSYACPAHTDSFPALFGEKGLFSHAGQATYLIDYAEQLDPISQKRLSEMTKLRHIIAIARTAGVSRFLCAELFYRLHAFEIRVPALDECPEDIPLLARHYFENARAKYGMYHTLTKSAIDALLALRWPGGRIQLESFMARLVISADKRTINDRAVKALYAELYLAVPTVCGSDVEIARDVPAAKETLQRERILSALQENFGDREKTAQALGMSRTTLWRRLKSYGAL